MPRMHLGLLVAASAVAPTARAQIDPTLARKYFDEAKAASARDGGNLWGVELYGPMLFADRETRGVVANQADAEGRLREEHGVWVGTLPNELNLANTAVRWAGTPWTMVVWPPRGDEVDRAQLMLHELWHRVQDDLGFPGANTTSSHLDSREGRIWLRLEWAALAEALRQDGSARRPAIDDALLFRAYRRSLFTGAAAAESSLEMNEGLAEYTGVRLASTSDAQAADRALRGLRKGEREETYVRSFAYAGGPAYGLLLDATSPEWRKGLRSEADLGGLLGTAAGFNLPDDLKAAAIDRAGRYEGDRIIADETKRDEIRQTRLAELRSKFVDGPVLIIPFRNMNIEFNPDNLVPLDDVGTYYPTCRIVDVWGILTVTDGAIIDPSWSKVTVRAPSDPASRPLTGPGWSLDLKSPWTPKPHPPRPGDCRLGD